MRLKLGVFAVIAMVLLGAGALCAPSHIYKDNDAGLTPLEAMVLKMEASEHSEIQPVWMQITEAVSLASPSGDINNPPLPDGVAIWRGPFGIRYGRTETRSGQVVRSSIDLGELVWAGLLLFLSEFALLVLAAFCFAPAIWGVVSRWERRNF